MLKKHLRSIASNPENTEIINWVLAEKIWHALTVLKMQLVEIVTLFNDNVTPAVAVTQSATIIWSDQFASFSNLVVLLDELSSKDDVHFSLHKTQNLKSSVKIASHVINFLTQLKKIVFRVWQALHNRQGLQYWSHSHHCQSDGRSCWSLHQSWWTGCYCWNNSEWELHHAIYKP